jgi:dTDP-4-amino-4,6-dideoxygalactose transaminase
MHNKILINDFKKESNSLNLKIIKRINDVIKEGNFILGKNVTSLENKWAKICGTRYCIATANGLDSIEIILKCLNLKKKDEVIVPSLTAFATILAVIKSGAQPVIADVNLQTGLMCEKSVKRLINKNTKCIILVHLYGRIENMKIWENISKKNNIFLIEDCAQSHLSKTSKGLSGSFGIASAFSFYPTKILGAYGDAGCIITNNKEINIQARIIRNYGQSNLYRHDIVGVNSRMDEIQASILLERIFKLKNFVNKRRKIAEIYNNKIQNKKIVKLKKPRNKNMHSYYLYVIRTQQREHLKKYMEKNNVQTLIHYPIPIHLQKVARKFKRDPIGLKNAEKFCATCLSIPCHPNLKINEIKKIYTIINNY